MHAITLDIPDELIEPVYNHVHHGRCFSLLERARLAMLKGMGFPNDQLLAEGKALVITHVEATYKREVKRGVVTVTCENPRIDGRTLVLVQRILNERGKVAVEARVESMFMDMETRRSMDVPEAFAAAFSTLGCS